jgi:hypothetical protein
MVAAIFDSSKAAAMHNSKDKNTIVYMLEMYIHSTKMHMYR